MTLNIQSISSKFLEFKELIQLLQNFNCAPDIICLQELWRFPNFANFSLNDYHPLIFKLRNSNVQGGGVGIYINKNLKYEILTPYSVFIDRIIETLFVQIELGSGKKIIIGK